MHRDQRVIKMKSLLRYLTVFSIMLGVANLLPAADKDSADVVVKSVEGSATLTDAERQGALKEGTVLSAGATIQTGPGSHVDLFFRHNNSSVRITPNSVVVLERVGFVETEKGQATQTVLNVKSGAVLGKVTGLRPEADYLVKIPGAICVVRGTEYYISATGVVHVLSGQVDVNLVIQMPNGDKVEKLVTVGANQSFIIPKVVTPTTINNLGPLPTPSSVTSSLLAELTRIVTIGPAAIRETFRTRKAGPLDPLATGEIQIDIPKVEIISN